MTNNDGGPAFPMPYTTENNGPAGMSLRDYFAAHEHIVIPSLDDVNESYYAARTGVALPKPRTSSDDSVREWAQFWVTVSAVMRYQQADAMLKAREQ